MPAGAASHRPALVHGGHAMEVKRRLLRNNARRALKNDVR
jgi:hypothetical protein